MRASLIVAFACALALIGSGVEGRSLRSLRHAAAPALHASQCGFAGLDFSSLQGKDIEGSDGGSRYLYYLSVCGPVSSQAAATCLQVQQESSACQLQVEGGAQTFDLGNWDASALPVWSYINASEPQVGVQYTMTGANQCWAQGGDAQPYQTTVQLVCAKEQGPLKVTTSLMSCLFTYQLPTPLACGASPPGPSPPGTCGFDGRDLSSLTGSDLVGSDGSSRYAYYLRVCGTVQSEAASSCASVNSHTGACQIQVQGGSQTFDLGNWDAQQPPVWELIDAKAPEKGVQYTMQGAQQCWAAGTAESYVTTVQFVCAASAKPLVVQTPLQPKPCGFTFVVETPLACPPPRQQPRHIVLTEQ